MERGISGYIKWMSFGLNKDGDTMQEQTKGIIFLFTIPFVVTFFVIISLLYAENLPDPLNVIFILLLSFGPLYVMLWYWINKFYFPKKDREKLIETL